jgi:hypothetical protein
MANLQKKIESTKFFEKNFVQKRKKHQYTPINRKSGGLLGPPLLLLCN